jgi:hypothetical protein
MVTDCRDRPKSLSSALWIVLLRRIQDATLPDLAAGLYMPLADIEEEAIHLRCSGAVGAVVLVGSPRRTRFTRRSPPTKSSCASIDRCLNHSPLPTDR